MSALPTTLRREWADLEQTIRDKTTGSAAARSAANKLARAAFLAGAVAAMTALAESGGVAECVLAEALIMNDEPYEGGAQ